MKNILSYRIIKILASECGRQILTSNVGPEGI